MAVTGRSIKETYRSIKQFDQMPLRAFVDDEEIISIDLTDEQWNDLKRRIKNNKASLRLPCCKQDGVLKISKGIKYFAHSDSDCGWKPESPAQLKAKAEIVEACKLNGWQAISEYAESDWCTDVLAVKNRNRIAFEIQWSNITHEEIKSKQSKFNESNVRGCWFLRQTPKEIKEFYGTPVADKDLPAFKIFQDKNSQLFGQIKQAHWPFKDLVAALLKRKFKFCEHIRLKTKQQVTIVFFEINCWNCNKTQHSYTVDKNLLTVCNRDFYYSIMWDDEDLTKNPQIYNAVNEFVKSERAKGIKVGQLKKRYSKTVNISYLSHGCFYCDSIFGDFPLKTERLYGLNDPNSIHYEVKVDLGNITEEEKHWCYSENGEFCE